MPVRVHWSAPLGAFFFGRFAWVPGFWLGFLLLILVHELGHAAMVRGTGQMVLSVDVHGLGGACRWVGPATPMQRALIAWGGVFAQMVLLVVALVVLAVLPPLQTPWALDLSSALIWTNLMLAGFNLLPYPPLDGAEAWSIVPLLRERWKRRASAKSKTTTRGKPSETGRTSERGKTAQAKPPSSFPQPSGQAEIRRVLEQTADIARREVERAKREKQSRR